MHLKPIHNIYVWIDFAINFDYIKEVLCINKEEPVLKCNGKCHLAKMLDNDSQESDKKEGIKIDRLKIEFIDFSNLYNPSKQQANFITKQKVSYYSYGLYDNVSFDIFHPPRV